MTEPRKDNSTIIAVVSAAALAGAGLFMWNKIGGKKIRPGDTITASFNFDYHADGGNYILQVRLGDISSIFHTFLAPSNTNLLWTSDITLTKPGHQKVDLKCLLPQGMATRVYDAEAQIKLAGMDVEHALIKKQYTNALKVEA